MGPFFEWLQDKLGIDPISFVALLCLMFFCFALYRMLVSFENSL